jgi:hypothetical protein
MKLGSGRLLQEIAGGPQRENNLVQYLSKQVTSETVSEAVTIMQSTKVDSGPSAAQVLWDNPLRRSARKVIGNRYEVLSVLEPVEWVWSESQRSPTR